MSIPSTGLIKFSDIQTVFGGTNPIMISEYIITMLFQDL